ncbi:MAG: GntR family transcriptional regulator [Desulfovibrionales bacterium]|nr:GntR family transcriptional regulator [Desulfovibrionales bacterium]
MSALGTTATLKIMKLATGGCFLDGKELGEVFLPGREIPAGVAVGDEVEVFIYRDSEAVLTATTSRPLAEVGQCAFMKVLTVTKAGAFVDWGLPKDLFVPASEQYKPLEAGRSYVILVYVDERTGRLAGTARLHSRLSEDGSDFRAGQEVDLIISGFSDLGYKAVINHTHLGLIFRDDTPEELRYGQKLKGYVKFVRTDKKIDLSLLPPGLSGLDMLGQRILEHLRTHGRSSHLTDQSPSADIAAAFGVSKSNYKKAVGRLYKQKKISIETGRIVLL